MTDNNFLKIVLFTKTLLLHLSGGSSSPGVLGGVCSSHPAGVGPEVVGEMVAVACPAVPMESTIEEGSQMPKKINKAKSAFTLCFACVDVKAAKLDSNSNGVAVVANNSRGFKLVKVVKGSFHQGDDLYMVACNVWQ